MKLHIIGSGTPDAKPDWCGSAFVLEQESGYTLIDCGPAATYKMAKVGIPAVEIHHLFFTHHHFDHNGDFPFFVLNRWDQSHADEPPLSIYGPKTTSMFVDKLIGPDGAFADDLKSRVVHPASKQCHIWRGGTLPRPGISYNVQELKNGSVVNGPFGRVTATSVQHVEPELLSLVYRFETEESSILFAGDCADCPALREAAKGVDTLVIACAVLGGDTTPKAISDCITGAYEAGLVAAAANVKQVILTHVTEKTGNNKQDAIDVVAESFNGKILFPNELEYIEL